jgi:hypothetical protein
MKTGRLKFGGLVLGVLMTFMAAPCAMAQVGTLSIEGECPGEVTVRITDGRSRSQYSLIFGWELGQFAIPHGHICSGTVLGIRRHIRYVTTFGTNDEGMGFYTAVAPSIACRHFLQAMQGGVCDPTNVVRIQ